MPPKNQKQAPAKQAQAKQAAAAPVKEESHGMGWKGEIFALTTIVYSHILCYYFYYCNFHNAGSLSLPGSIGETSEWLREIFSTLYTETFPTWYACAIYFGFIAIETILGVLLPGVWVKGLPVPSEGNKQHWYLCNGLACWWTTLALVAVLHLTGLWRLNELARNLGPVLTVSVIFGNVMAIIIHVAAHICGKVNRKSGFLFYDLFMGVFLNPRVGYFDLKIWAEIRVSWTLLFFLTVSAALEQYDRLGYVSGNMWVMVVAHFLYSNACQKGEECIPTTWDIFHENWGWMLIFWNLAGVPFVYCFQSFFILHNPQVQLSNSFILFLFIVLFCAYYVWDTANSQKNFFRMEERGTWVDRKWAFPRLPWRKLNNPKHIKAANGGTLLIDGWWGYLRKIHYSADVCMALVWAMSCGFSKFLPFYYPLFFVSMLIHREWRDRLRLSKKYGKDWDRYIKAVPYAFFPGIY